MEIDRYRYDPREGETVVARRSYHPRRAGLEDGFAAHDHDYAEVFWIERGRCWHTVNGLRRRLAAGDAVFMRPRDAHVLRCADAHGFTIVNMTLRAEACEDLRCRHRIAAARWPWRPGSQPLHARFAPASVRLLAGLIDALGPRPHDSAARDLVMLAAVQAARSAQPGSAGHGAPPWLASALVDPAVVPGGFAALVAASVRSAAHVNRTVRRCFGTTATDLVARLRIEEAARRLSLGDERIVDVALACGFPNLAHFYRRFALVTGTTPRRYRLRAQRGI